MGNKTLNLRAMNCLLNDVDFGGAAHVADILDNLFCELAYYAEAANCGGSHQIDLEDGFLYTIRELRNVFLKTAIDNGELLEFSTLGDTYTNVLHETGKGGVE